MDVLLDPPDRPESRQFLHRLLRYAESDAFNPEQLLDVETLKKNFVGP